MGASLEERSASSCGLWEPTASKVRSLTTMRTCAALLEIWSIGSTRGIPSVAIHPSPRWEQPRQLPVQLASPLTRRPSPWTGLASS